MGRNPFSFAMQMNSNAAITGQRSHESDPTLTLTENDIINVDKFKVSEVKLITAQSTLFSCTSIHESTL